MSFKKIYLFIFLSLVLIGFVNAEKEICIDLDDPSAPNNLQVSGNIALGWDIAIDKPNCSGIDYYKIYLNDSLIGTSNSTSYSADALSNGNYTLSVSAVDLAGNEGDKRTLQVTFPLVLTPTTTGGGTPTGGGSSRTTTTGSEATIPEDECQVDEDCSEGYICGDEYYTNKIVKLCVKQEESVEEESEIISEETTPTGGGLITGAAVTDVITKNPVVAAIVIIIVLALITGAYFYFRNKRTAV